MSAVDDFASVVGGPADAVRLDMGCLLVAAHVRGDPDPQAVVGGGVDALDDLAARCPDPTLDGLLAWLFGDLGFTGNRRRYDDPRNSYLDDVLRRRRGIPITLSLVVTEVGRRLALELVPVGMPGHFLVGAGAGRYIDAFHGGTVLDESAARARFAEVVGGDTPWSPALLAPTDPRAVLARVLANLRANLSATRQLAALERVLELRLAIPGVPDRERADRASVLAALGRYDEAAAELERLATSVAAVGVDEGLASDQLRARAARLRARLN